ncbi:MULTISPECIES: hypothetical protein [Xanthomonas]|uniref:Secreted protein n=1 Tax=Xanthomonas cucurbitae TaxID=56453 RepID=A0A2S7DNM8_9XANT|nr:hypothetical protein [Xanthomonas cucurbitae]PPU75359.1 hypothetical protein XcuCFBP2542_14670 [Xanthomonas cucurbitae]QHG87263.1 hypothetical protein EBN15_09940 [Xanthomonas cucurbitae]WDM66109.1 hypothetical protein K6981_10980 [Xanthomonas cucurbitae]WDM69988.1 hypothetical protein K6978_10955 [Xanthomonas cucurbitae]WDM73796.1 hypothetical protein K6982_09915 [Xanthomonas cucurbitae]
MRALMAMSCLLLSPAAALAQGAPVRPDLPALIECRQRIGDFNALAPVLADPLKAVALGWTPLDQSNLFMTEYTLNTPIKVFGHSTHHIAFSGASIMAILDLPDPRPLAKQLDLELGVDNADKVMYGRELVSEDTINPKTGEAMIESVVLSVTNVKSHPGKTVVGCGYSLDLP